MVRRSEVGGKRKLVDTEWRSDLISDLVANQNFLV